MIDSRRPAIAFIAIASLLTGCQTWQQGSDQTLLTDTVTRQFTTGNEPAVAVETFNGDVAVVAGPPGEVSVTVTRKGSGRNEEAAARDLATVDVQMSQDGGPIRIVARRANGAAMSTGSGAKVEVTAPLSAALNLRSSNGAVRSAGIQGSISAHSSNGGITILDAAGSVSASASNGKVDVQGAVPVALKLNSSNGAISFRGPLAPGESTFSTSKGSITLELPASAAFAVDVSTSDGKITTDFPVTGGTQSKSRLTGETSPRSAVVIHARTSNGAVEIRRQ